MPSLRHSFAFPAAFLALGVASTGIHLGLTRDGARAPSVDTQIIPKGSDIVPFVLKQRTSVADLYFLALVQYLGTPSRRAEGYPRLFEFADAITDIDPLYGYAYEVAGIALTEPLGRFEESNAILAKGMANVPGRWQLPFFSAFNLWHGGGDYVGAASLLLRASQCKDAPAYLPDLASRLIAESFSIEDGIALLDTVIMQMQTPSARSDLEARRRELLIERDLRRIDSAAARFASRFGRRPTSLQELVRAEPIALPDYEVRYNPEDGEATSPLLPSRIRLYRPHSSLLARP